VNRNLLRQILVMVSVIATIIVNGLANALPINGQQTGDISDRFDVFFVPAGYVFSIWGLIYVGLVAYAVYQILPAQRDNPRLRSIDILFYVSSAANIIWIFLWHYEYFVLTMVVMVILLLSLIAIYQRLGIGLTRPPAGERWFVHLPFSIYLGWITVATIANATSVLDFVNWNRFGISEQTWFLIMLAVALVVAALMTWMRGDVAYLLVLAWAFAGIGVKHADNSVVSTASWVATGIVLLFVLVTIIRRTQGKPALAVVDAPAT
jgi:hypothetical protein